MAEVRINPADGKRNTKAEFLAQYGGSTEEWDCAAGAASSGACMAVEPELESPQTAAGDVKQVDLSDGNACTRDEFVVAYGGAAECDRTESVPIRKAGVKYCCCSSTSPARSQAKLMVAHLTRHCGWVEWPCEKHTYGTASDPPVTSGTTLHCTTLTGARAHVVHLPRFRVHSRSSCSFGARRSL